MPATPPFIRWFYLLGLSLVACGLPWSRKFLSVAMMALGAAWLIEAIILKKLPRVGRFFSKPKQWLPALLFLPYLIGLGWTTDMVWGLKLLAIVLPLALYPYFFAVLPELYERERNGLLLLFVSSVLVASVVGFCIINSSEGVEFREFSPFISHIRFGLMVCLSIAISAWFIARAKSTMRFLLAIPLGWFLYYLSLLASVQGAFIVFALLLFLLWSSPAKFAIVGKVISVALIGVVSYVLLSSYQDYFSLEPLPENLSEMRTAQGNEYSHEEERGGVERGKRVWAFWNAYEFSHEWKKRSSIELGRSDGKGQDITHTAARYLTSLGLKKDAEGVAALSDEDVRRIESGIAWHDSGKRNALLERLDMIYFEIDKFDKYGYAEGSSVAMRLVFQQAAWSIAKNNFWFGVGTGDTPNAFAQAHLEFENPLPEEYRLRAHQQYLTWWVSWGIFGLVFILLVIAVSSIQNRKKAHPLFIPFLIIMLTSFFTDDTMERQIGVTLFAFFFGLLLLAPIRNQEVPDKEIESSLQ